jgi:hypothetical protein
MSTVVIPTNTTALFWNQITTLDGVQYSLTFRYNSREACYYLQIASSDQSITYAQGLKLVSNFPLLTGYATPPGELLAVSFSATDDSPAELGEMGDGQRVALMYVEQADLLAGGGESWRDPGGGL